MAYERQKSTDSERRPWQREQKRLDADLSFLDNGFYDHQGNLREDLLDQRAREWGEKFAPEDSVKKGSDEVSSAQIRRFYGDVKSLRNEIRQSGINMELGKEEDLAPFKARIKMLKSKVSYAASKGNVSRSFHQLIERCVNNIKRPQDFVGFALFFESLLGYYYYFEDIKKATKRGGRTSYE